MLWLCIKFDSLSQATELNYLFWYFKRGLIVDSAAIVHLQCNIFRDKLGYWYLYIMCPPNLFPSLFIVEILLSSLILQLYQGKRLVRKWSDDKKPMFSLEVFELLATVAGKLLTESEGPSDLVNLTNQFNLTTQKGWY